ncbi:MAG: hypothetical protein D6677_10445 [Calditrichaeota bacterium]|nr:MAG: hypothetical protein D6677_10445 [Calditrichota bacterium]
MKKDTLEQWLSQKAQSPTPVLQADPFLPTRIEALARAERHEGLSWTIRGVLAAAALLLGVYISADIMDNGHYANPTDTTYASWASAVMQNSIGDQFQTIKLQETETYDE